MTAVKRQLNEIETELEAATRLKAETKDRIKRLKLERDTHDEFIEWQRRNETRLLSIQLPPYLFDSLVRHPIDPDKYGALRSYSIRHERDSREIKNGIYADQLLVTLVFEKNRIDYELDTSNGSYETHYLIMAGSMDRASDVTMTQQALWMKLLELNHQDIGMALVGLCRDCYRCIDDFEDTDISAPLREIEAYRRLHCKLPHVDADDMREFYALEMTQWLAKWKRPVDMTEHVRRVNASHDLYNTDLCVHV